MKARNRNTAAIATIAMTPDAVEAVEEAAHVEQGHGAGDAIIGRVNAPVRLTVNGEAVERQVDARRSLGDFLREDLGLTGTHVGCEHGVCGACTVRLDGVSVRGCCLLAVQADGSTVETVESLAGDAMLSPLQEAFKRHHALQCGFCTPGILIAADDLLSRGRPSREAIVDMLSGQLCRCTGYAPIVAAIEEVASEGAP